MIPIGGNHRLVDSQLDRKQHCFPLVCLVFEWTFPVPTMDSVNKELIDFGLFEALAPRQPVKPMIGGRYAYLAGL